MATGWKLRDDFEAWVQTRNPYGLVRVNKPGYFDDYVDPWTAGAWAAWQRKHDLAKPPASAEPITKESWDNACAGLGTKA